MAQEGQKVSVSYVGRYDDGEVFDSTEKHGGELLSFVVGDGKIIPGFDAAVRDLEVGETQTVAIEPKDAYGEYNDSLVQVIPIAEIGGLGSEMQGRVGQYVRLQDNMGNVQEVKIVAADDTNVTLDFNHPMAGKKLNFEITLESVED